MTTLPRDRAPASRRNPFAPTTSRRRLRSSEGSTFWSSARAPMIGDGKCDWHLNRLIGGGARAFFATILRSIRDIDRGLPDCQRMPGTCRPGPVGRAQRPPRERRPRRPDRGARSLVAQRPRPPPRARGQVPVDRPMCSTPCVCASCGCPAGQGSSGRREHRVACCEVDGAITSAVWWRARVGGRRRKASASRPGAGPMWLIAVGAEALRDGWPIVHP